MEEELVRSIAEGEIPEPHAVAPKHATKTPEEYLALQKILSEKLKTKVRFKIGEGGKGSIMIPFKSEMQLEALLESFDKMLQ